MKPTSGRPDLVQTNQVTVSGFRLLDGIWYAQIVGVVTKKENADPRPGTAVYTVLSGSFDHVPE